MLKQGKKKQIFLLLLSLFFALASGILAGGAPNFKLNSTEEQTYELADVLGEKVVLVSFWALWCKPCRKELVEIEKIHQEYKEKPVAVLSINTDTINFKSKVKSYVKRLKLEVPVLMDSESQVIKLYNPRVVMPYTFIIGLDGLVAYTHTGYNDGDEIILRQKIDEMLTAAGEKETP